MQVMRILIILSAVAVLCIAAHAEDDRFATNSLREGQVLLCDSEDAVTIYQLTQLGYSYAGIRAFQRETGLKADGIIGPKTKQKVQDIYKKQFAPNRFSITSPPLVVIGQPNTDATAMSVRLVNTSTIPLRIMGRLSLSDMKVVLGEPVLYAVRHWCEQRGEMLAYMIGKTKISLGDSGTTISPGGFIERPSAPGTVEFLYLTWEGTVFSSRIRIDDQEKRSVAQQPPPGDCPKAPPEE